MDFRQIKAHQKNHCVGFFFITGSEIQPEINGTYRVAAETCENGRPVYVHEDSGWVMHWIPISDDGSGGKWVVADAVGSTPPRAQEPNGASPTGKEGPHNALDIRWTTQKPHEIEFVEESSLKVTGEQISLFRSYFGVFRCSAAS